MSDFAASSAPSHEQSTPISILHVTEVPLGGVVTCMRELLNHQAKRGFARIEVLTPEINEAELGTADGKIRLTTFPYARANRSDLAILAIRVLRRAWASRPDVIHAHSSYAGVAVRILRPFLPRRTRLVYCPHGWAFYRDTSKFSKTAVIWVERLLSFASDRIICVSEREARDASAHGISERKLTVILNGISQTPQPGPTEPRSSPLPIIGFIGRYDQQKGYDVFLDVMRRLKGMATGLSVGGQMVGGDDELPDAPSNVRDIGWVTRGEATKVLAEMDLLMMPSRWEGLPIVALEALRSGVGIVASTAGGLPEVVQHNSNGLLIESLDAEKIAEAIRATDLATMRDWGKSSREMFLKSFSSDRMEEATWRLYQEVTERASRR